METMARSPDQSFPEACGDNDSALEATYRFLSNDSVAYEKLLEPHIERTSARMGAEGEVLVVQDTTEFRFEGDREGMGRLQQDLQGFMGHFALAVSADGQRRALGIIGLLPIFRSWDRVTVHWRERAQDPNRESLRWGQLADQVSQRFPKGPALIHVMDREAESYELLSSFIAAKQRFVLRVRAESRRTTSGQSVAEATNDLVTIATREVPVSARKERYTKGTTKNSPKPARSARTARLQVRACSIEIKCPDRSTASGSLKINIVHVVEMDPPEGQEAVDWKLYTTDPINTAEQVLLTVDRYQSRWVIEEYFKALKTGCAYEKRQLTSRRALLNALAIFIPIAWTLLLLRQDCRATEPGASPSALTPGQLQVLRAVCRKPPPVDPTAREVLLAIAALGGHIKSNGDPGWRVLGRGLEKLLSYEVGWNAATRDQS
jgi:hypothetical protein